MAHCDMEELHKRVMELEDEKHQLQRKCNDMELQWEKTKTELSLKSDIWREKESFYRLKQSDTESRLVKLQEKAQNIPPMTHSDIELKARLLASEKKTSTLKIELHSIKKEMEAKMKVEGAKNALVELQEKRIDQLKRENQGLLQRMVMMAAAAAAAQEERDASPKSAETNVHEDLRSMEIRIAVQEKAYNSVLKQNEQLKKMLHSLEDKCRDIAKLAKEKVMAYVKENSQLKESVSTMESCLREIGDNAEERKERETSLGLQFANLRLTNNQLKTQVSQLSIEVEEKRIQNTAYKEQVKTLSLALQAAGVAPYEPSVDDMLDTLNESEFLSRKLQSGLEGLRRKLGYQEDPYENLARLEHLRLNGIGDVGSKNPTEAEKQLQQMIQEITDEEKDIATTLRMDIEEKRKALERLKHTRDECEKTKSEKAKLLAEAQESIAQEMQNTQSKLLSSTQDTSEDPNNSNSIGAESKSISPEYNS